MWNIWDKFVLMYSWDNSYNGDVYIYPMIRKGFQEDNILKLLHNVMRFFHYPVFVLSVLGIVLFLIRWSKGTLPIRQRVMVLPAMMFVYLLSVLYFLSWLPRYTIPVRPISYILAAASVAWLIRILRSADWVGAKGDDGNDGE